MMLLDRHVPIDWTKRHLYDLMADAVEWMHEHLHTPVTERAWLEEADNREQPFGPDPLRPRGPMTDRMLPKGKG